MKLTLKIALVSLVISNVAFAGTWVPGKVNYILQSESHVKVSLSRTDNGTTIWRFLPAAQEKNMLAMLLTAMSADKTVSCYVSGANFSKCFVYANAPVN